MDKIGKFNVTELDNGSLKVSGESINDRYVDVPEGDFKLVNGVWNVQSLPLHYIVELADSSLAMFHISPFRKIVDKDLQPYRGYHPRKSKGNPMPEYLYKFYGLQRDEEGLSETLRVRISPGEKEKLETYCANLEPKLTISEFLREYIRKIVNN
jgi:hypothetical protein